VADRRAEARQILNDAIVIDALGGAVVHPTPHVANGTYEGNLVRDGWTALHVTLVSEPSYTPTWEQVQRAIYENLLHFAMNHGVRHVERVDDLRAAKRDGQLGVILGLQSPSCIEGERERLRLLHKLGLRSLQLTYMERNRLGDGCLEPENRGLTHFGMQVIRECNRLGIVVDCSHVGVQTTLDAAQASRQPIVISHTAVRALTDNPRCVTDEQMKAVAATGGLVGITAYAPFIRYDRRPTLDDYVDHFDYVADLVGVDHVGFATDWFDGKTKTNWATPWYYPEVTRGTAYGALGLEGFAARADLPNLVAKLLERGRGAADIAKILGGNYLRVLEAVWQ
jgi:membrane dipeptidase